MASTSKPESFEDKLVLQLECLICSERLTPPIYLCLNGHNVCSECYNKISRCSICKGPMTNMRNRFAEHISTQIRYPCKMHSEGCGRRFSLEEMKAHLPVCEFRVNCLVNVLSSKAANGKYLNCPWQGPRSQILSHVEQNHKKNIVMGNLANVKYKVHSTQVVLMCMESTIVWCIFSFDAVKFSLKVLVFCVAALAQQINDMKFTYKLKLLSENKDYKIITTKKVGVYQEGLVELFLSDESGSHVVLQGNFMVERFLQENFFDFCLEIKAMTDDI